IFQVFGIFTGQSRQLLTSDIQLVFCSNALALAVVIAGAGFVHLGDRDQADIETFLSLFILALDSCFSRAGCCNGVLSAQDIKIGGCNIQNQLLLGQVVLGLGGFGLELAGVVAEPVVGAENRLRQLNAVVE